MSTETINYRIPNWAKFNPRSDRANYSWFRLENRLFGDQKFYPLTDSQKVLWIFLICEVSKINTDRVELLVSYISAMTGHKTSQIISDFERLSKAGLVAAESRHDAGEEPAILPATRRTYERDETRRDERNETNGATSGLSPVIATLADPLTSDILAGVKPSVQESWIALYGDVTWVKQEIQQAEVWCRANPSRRPKSDFARFITKWLARGWERHRKTLPSNPVPITKPFRSVEAMQAEQEVADLARQTQVEQARMDAEWEASFAKP